jgi:hypothetical protein
MLVTAVTFQWADGMHTFDLKLGQLRELEEKCKAGFPVVLERLLSKTFHADDIKEVLRLGLIGGGMPASKAWLLVTRYYDDKPKFAHLNAAVAVLAASCHGIEDSLEDKPNPRRAKSKAAGSTSPRSMVPARSSGSRRDKSTSVHSASGSPSSKPGISPTAPNRKLSRRPSTNIATDLQG